MSSAAGGSSALAGSSSSSPSSKPPPPQESRPQVPRAPTALLFPPAPLPLHITVRFSIALPDIQLEIPSPQQTTVVALKHLIRRRLAADAEAEASDNNKKGDGDAPGTQTPSPAAQASRARLRFIHNGRILPDAAVLSAVLKAPPPPPPSHRPPDPKGKSPAGAHKQQRVFINCSIGDPLPEADIAAEAEAATAPPPPTTTTSSTTNHPKLSVTTTGLDQHGGQQQQQQQQQQNHSGVRSRPRTQNQQHPAGFDRLLQAGLTPAEIATLRSHFRAIHTARFTPDTMPSPDTLRAMEDAWLDGGGGGGLPSTADFAGGGGAGGGNGGETGEGGEVVEDVFGINAVAGPLIKGMMIGFMFPLGVIGWLDKEEGVWSESMQTFVILGVMVSVLVGVVRALTGEG
ncbi:hypothetical protein VTH82DRAFT_203 [Thermothelomyces myriococcoides]